MAYSRASGWGLGQAGTAPGPDCPALRRFPIMGPGFPGPIDRATVASRLNYLEPFGAQGLDEFGYVVPQQSSGPVALTTAAIRAGLQAGCFDAGPAPAPSLSGDFLGRLELQGGRPIFKWDEDAGSGTFYEIRGPAAGTVRALFPAGQTGGVAPASSGTGPGLWWLSGTLYRASATEPIGYVDVQRVQEATAGHGIAPPIEMGGREFEGLTEREQERLYQDVLQGGIIDPDLVTDYEAAQAERVRIALEREGVSDPSQLDPETRRVLAESGKDVEDWLSFCAALRSAGYDCDRLRPIAGSSWLEVPEYFLSELEKGGPGGAWEPFREGARIPPDGTNGNGRGWGPFVLGGALLMLLAARRRS